MMADEDDSSTLQHFCEQCNQVTSFECNVGCWFCIPCGLQTPDFIQTGVDHNDISTVYSQTLRRRRPRQVASTDVDADADADALETPKLPELEITVARAIRSRYIEGLQVMQQKQCEALVKTFGVCPIICGMLPPVWLRHLVTSGVYSEAWAPSLIADYQDQIRAKQPQPQGKSKNLQLEKFILRRLQKLIPINSTVAISFLLCHLAREPVLPTDIIDWAEEVKLPYLSFFCEMDRHIGTSPAACPLENRTMFRPEVLLGPWHLEVAAGKIAKKIGLHLPPVNFYAMVRRWLDELDLPMEILPRACRVYEWLWPAGIWISEEDFVGFPTRVSVMSLVIIALRVLYDVNGYGTWEKSLSTVTNKQGSVQKDVTVDLGTSSKPFDAGELFRVLEAVHKDLEVKHDHLKDLNSYVKYCKDVIYAEMPWDSKWGVKKTIEILSNIYDKHKDDSDMRPKNLDFEHKDLDERRYVDSSLRKDRKLDMMRFEMEENNFYYLPPVLKRKSEGYISYRAVKVDGKLVYALHADYYIILRALAKVARVDMKSLHVCTLEMEKKLDWIEEKIRKSLKVAKDGVSSSIKERKKDGSSSSIKKRKRDGSSK